MTIDAKCRSCGHPFQWEQTYASRNVVRHFCRSCRRTDSTSDRVILRDDSRELPTFHSRFSRKQADGIRVRATFGEFHHIDGRETMRVGRNRGGCPSCSLPFSECNCPRSKP